jgi:hypothetical protein
VGEHFREDGSPKRRFTSERQALEHIRRFGHNCYPYHCSICDGWHLATARRIA